MEHVQVQVDTCSPFFVQPAHAWCNLPMLMSGRSSTHPCLLYLDAFFRVPLVPPVITTESSSGIAHALLKMWRFATAILFSGIGKVHTLWDTSSRTRTEWFHQIWQYKHHSLQPRLHHHPSVLCHHSVPSSNGNISRGQHLFVDWPDRYIASIHL